MRLFFAILLTSLSASAQSIAVKTQPTDGKVWGALVHATSGEPVELPKEVPSALSDLSARLAKVLPQFSRFEILGQQHQDILRQYDSWVVPTKDICLKLDSKGRSEEGGIKLGLQFWQDKTILVKSDLILQKQSPLIITGPKWKEGQLLFVLLLTRVD